MKQLSETIIIKCLDCGGVHYPLTERQCWRCQSNNVHFTLLVTEQGPWSLPHIYDESRNEYLHRMAVEEDHRLHGRMEKITNKD